MNFFANSRYSVLAMVLWAGSATAQAAVVSTTVTDAVYDDYGNRLSQITQVSVNEPAGIKNYTQTALSTYSVSTAGVWLPGLLTCSLTASQIPAEAGLLPADLLKVSSTSYVYYTEPGLLDKIHFQRSGTISAAAVPSACAEAPASQSLLTTLTYDGRGMLASSSLGEGADSRTTTTTPSSNARVMTVTNPVGHQNVQHINVFGQQVYVVDPNNLIAVKTYDLLGRTLRDGDTNTGIPTVATYDTCATGCEANEVLKAVITTTNGGVQVSAPVTRYLDRLGRELRTVTKGFDNRDVIVKSSFDAKGNLVQKTLPYLSPVQAGEQIRTVSMTYDSAGRLKTTTETGGALSQLDYPGAFEILYTNAKNQKRTELRDGLGRTRKVTDNLRLSQHYVYDAAGKLRRSVDPKGNVTELFYDAMGNRNQFIDPDMGTWSYTHDIFGNVTSQTDNKGQTVSFVEYDKLNRLRHRIEPDMESFFQYDNHLYGKGKLTREYNKLANGAMDYSHYFYFDSQGRANGELFNGTGDTARSFSYVYGSNNKIKQVDLDYASQEKFSYQYKYDNNSYLTEVAGVAPDTTVYWKANARDAYGRATRATLGNGRVTERKYKADTGYLDTVVTGTLNADGSIAATIQNDSYGFDAIGNLVTRNQNAGASLNETFAYDAANRAVSATVLGQAGKAVRYDEVGNIAWKSDVGNYHYGQAVNALDPAFDPAQSSGQPSVLAVNAAASDCTGVHRVCATHGNLETTLGYDNNGNLLSGNNRSYQNFQAQNAWTSFNQPIKIVRQNGAVDTFWYSTSHERIRRVTEQNNQTTTQYSYHPRIDSGLTYEVTYKPGNSVDRAYYLYADGLPIGNVVRTTTSTNAVTTAVRYFHTDNLGSITAITDTAGQVLQNLSYDLWGKRRNLTGTDDSAGVLTGTASIRGYTGHEMLDSQGLIHMNGRLYDPQLARFVSADPTIDGVNSIQGFNRYAYVHNNPGTLTDPSGFSSSYGDFYITYGSATVSISVTSHQGGSSIGAIIVSRGGASSPATAQGSVTQGSGGTATVYTFASPTPFTADSEFVRASGYVSQAIQVQMLRDRIDYWMSQIVLPGNCWTNDCDAAAMQANLPCNGDLDCAFAGALQGPGTNRGGPGGTYGDALGNGRAGPRPQRLPQYTDEKVLRFLLVELAKHAADNLIPNLSKILEKGNPYLYGAGLLFTMDPLGGCANGFCRDTIEPVGLQLMFYDSELQICRP